MSRLLRLLYLLFILLVSGGSDLVVMTESNEDQLRLLVL